MNARTNERTNERKGKNYIPPHTLYVGGIKKSAQVIPISEDISAQIAEDNSANKNQTRHLLMH